MVRRPWRHDRANSVNGERSALLQRGDDAGALVGIPLAIANIKMIPVTCVPLGKDILVQAVQSMSVTDAKNILTGGDTSVTAFFAEKTRIPLGERFLPVVTRATEKVGLAQRYNAFAGKAAGFGLLRNEDANLEQYVTGKTLDGLYLVIGEEEKKIRQNPAGAGSAIVRKVFGALR